MRSAVIRLLAILEDLSRFGTSAVEPPRQDFAEFHGLQDQLQFTPISAWGKPYTPPSDVLVDPAVDLTATPYDQLRLMTGEMFFKRLTLLLMGNPLGALTSDEAVYPSTFVDGDGEILDGASNYVLHFGKDEMLPSVGGVWSVSAYRENFYVRNSIERNGIISAMPLKYNTDGSLDVYIQATTPGADKEANCYRALRASRLT
jgi:hypothetical protein